MPAFFHFVKGKVLDGSTHRASLILHCSEAVAELIVRSAQSALCVDAHLPRNVHDCEQHVAELHLDSCNARHGVFQAARLADLLGGWHYAFRSAMPYAGGGYGSGLVCRDRIRRTFAIPIPRGDGSEPRVCVVAETRRYVIASTHLDHISEASRVEGARRIAEALTARYGRSRKPVFLLGDMNDRPGSAPLRELEKHFTVLSGTDPTYPSDEPHICIDYVLVLRRRGVRPFRGRGRNDRVRSPARLRGRGAVTGRVGSVRPDYLPK